MTYSSNNLPFPVNSLVRVKRSTGSNHCTRIGEIVIFKGLSNSSGSNPVCACIVERGQLDDPRLDRLHDCNGFFYDPIGRNFYLEELELVELEDDDDLYI